MRIKSILSKVLLATFLVSTPFSGEALATNKMSEVKLTELEQINKKLEYSIELKNRDETTLELIIHERLKTDEKVSYMAALTFDFNYNSTLNFPARKTEKSITSTAINEPKNIKNVIAYSTVGLKDDTSWSVILDKSELNQGKLSLNVLIGEDRNVNASSESFEPMLERANRENDYIGTFNTNGAQLYRMTLEIGDKLTIPEIKAEMSSEPISVQKEIIRGPVEQISTQTIINQAPAASKPVKGHPNPIPEPFDFKPIIFAVVLIALFSSGVYFAMKYYKKASETPEPLEEMKDWKDKIPSKIKPKTKLKKRRTR